jgi:pimeloyl-ACP methyl ester carboxylesterase
MTAIDGRAVTDDGAELFWSSRGEGPAVLLIAGQGTTHRCWLHVVPELAATRRVVVYDHRGVGRSTAGDRSRYSTRAFADDAIAVLDAAGIDRAAAYSGSPTTTPRAWRGWCSPPRPGETGSTATATPR